MIKSMNGLFFVFNHTGKKRLSSGYNSKKAAVKRLQEIEYFKNKRGGK